MNFILIVFLFLGSIQPDSDSLLLEHSKQQAAFYIDQLNNGQDQDTYLWALSSIYQTHPVVQDFIIKKIEEEELNQDFFKPFISSKENAINLAKDIVFATGSQALLIDLILKTPEKQKRLEIKSAFENKFGLKSEDGIDYNTVLKKIIRGERIDSTLLPNESFRLAHFFLIMDNQGYKLVNRGYLESILKKWEETSSNTQRASMSHSIMQVTLFRTMYILDQYEVAKRFFSFFTMDKLIPNTLLKYKIFRYLDYSMYRMGYYDLALKASRNHAGPLAKYLGNKQQELNTLSAQAAYLDHIGKIKEAQKVNLEILEKSVKSGIEITKPVLFHNLALTHFKSGEFDKYLDLLLQALEEANKQEKYVLQIDILTSLYIYYIENQNKEAALLYLNEARVLAESEGNTSHLGRINIYLGVLYRDFEKNYQKAISFFSKSKSLLEPDNDFLYYTELLDEEADLYYKLNQAKKSRDIYNKIATVSKSKDPGKFLEAKLQLIQLDLEKNKLESAKNLLTEVKSYDLNQLDFKNIIKAKTVEADYLIATGSPGEAYDIMKPALEQVVARAKNSTSIQTGFWNVVPQYLDAFELTADMLISTERYEEAVEVLDKLKTINDASLYQNPMVKSSLLDETQLTQYQRLTQQLDALRKKQLLATEREQLSIQSKIDKISAQKRMLDRKISNEVDRQDITINEVQRNLAGREMVLHITELNDWYYVARISRSDVQLNKVRLDSTLRGQFRNAITNLSLGKTDINELNQISKVLNLDEIPAWVESLTIIPDSYLYQLPIDILPLNNEEHGYSYGEATYFIERFKTHYLTSLNDFRKTESVNTKQKLDFIGYGVSEFSGYADSKKLVPLPFAGSEVSNIETSLTNVESKRVYLNSSSSEKTFKETASTARILHFATHSEISERDPLFSTIYMSPDSSSSEEENFSGQIFAYELFELNLSNDLIMLNSCESGSGSYLQGAGVMGISRALRYAGANSVILNLWSVNDMMASDFAIEFYKNINEGQAKDEALRNTKLHFLKNKNANPHYWGPYMLIGNRDPLVKPHRETNIYFAASFMLFFITIASFSIIKEWKKKAA